MAGPLGGGEFAVVMEAEPDEQHLDFLRLGYKIGNLKVSQDGFAVFQGYVRLLLIFRQCINQIKSIL